MTTEDPGCRLPPGKIRLILNADGTGMELVGGYRNWRDLYAQNVFAQAGGQQGVREHEDHIALYYALRRHADGLYNPKTGPYDGVSCAYRMKLAPAFVVHPDKPMDDAEAEGLRRHQSCHDQGDGESGSTGGSAWKRRGGGRGGVPLERRRGRGAPANPAPNDR